MLTLSNKFQNSIIALQFALVTILSIILFLLSSKTGFSSRNILLLKICIFIFFSFYTSYSVGFQLVNPFVWFNFIFTLYSISTPILYLAGDHSYLPTFSKTLDLEFFGLISFSVFSKQKVYSFKKLGMESINKMAVGNTIFFYLCLSVIFVSLYYQITSGITNRYQKILNYSPLYYVDFLYFFLNISICIYLLNIKRRKRKLRYLYIFLYFGFLLLSFLISGHRNIVFRYILILVLLYDTMWEKIGKIKLLIATFVLILISTVSNDYKMYLLKSNNNGIIETNTDLLYTFFGSELRTPSENLSTVLMSVPSEIDFFYGETFIWDISQGLSIGFISSRTNFQNTSVWFTKTFFPSIWDLGGGVGFTLVGTAFINFGLFGVIAIFSLLGMINKVLYKKSSYSAWWFVLYINFIPIVIYSIRSDFSVLLAQTLKHTLVPMFFLSILSNVIIKLSSKKIIKRQSNEHLYF